MYDPFIWIQRVVIGVGLLLLSGVAHAVWGSFREHRLRAEREHMRRHVMDGARDGFTD